MLLDVGEHYPALTKTGRDLYVEIPPDGKVILILARSGSQHRRDLAVPDERPPLPSVLPVPRRSLQRGGRAGSANLAKPPAQLRAAVLGLSEPQFDTPYRRAAGPCAR
jgi:hypothetical protein